MNEQVGRRGFMGMVGKASGFLLLMATTGVSFLTSGCNVLTDVKAWIPVGLAAFSSVVSLLQSAGVINPIEGSVILGLINTVKAAFAQILSDIAQYQAITPPPAGLLAKIEAGLQIVVTNIQTFLSTINVSNNPIISLVTGLIQIILSTIAAFQGQLPSASSVKQFKLAGQTVTVTPVKRDKKQFISDFDVACVAAGHPEAEIH